MRIHKILIKKSSFPILAVFIVSGLFFQYQPADAFAFLAALPLMGQLFSGFLANAKEALNFVDTTIMHLLVWTAALSALASVFLTFSAGFLDFVSGFPIKLGSGNNLVTVGWNLSSGLVNSIFILIFLGIALSYIFKTETFGMKKALPRLIIIALLINFSLLFVKIFVDFGWIVQNAIKNMVFGESDLVMEVIGPLKKILLVVHSKMFGQIMAYALTGLIPGGAIIKIYKMLTVVLGEGLFGSLSQAFLLIAFGFVGGLTFFAYGLLFLARIVVINLLAIAAPLALAAYILPSTQKYFHQWFRALIQWVFLGVIVYFLMGIGLKLYTLVAPAQVLGGFSTGYMQIIFLFVYLWVVLTLSKKFVPKGMDGIWKAGEAVTRTGIMAAGAGGLVAAKAIKTGWGAGRTAYAQARQQFNFPRGQALRWAARRGWTEPGARSAIGPAAATKGVLKALGSAAKAGAMAGAGPSLPFGIKLKQAKKKPKQTKQCTNPACLQWTDTDDTFCPHCGTIFP